jgi:hypothetical protein
MSCSVDIDPKFVHSIRSNICAGCGGPLMTENSQELMDSLKEALLQMPNDPEGLAVWLLSNYNMVKVGTGEPVQRFYGTNAKYSGTREEIDESNLKIRDNSNMSKFFKRAGVPNIDKSSIERKKFGNSSDSNKNYASLAQSIQNGDDYDLENGFEDEGKDYNEDYNEDYNGESDEGFDYSTFDYSSLISQASSSNILKDNNYLEIDRLNRLQKQQDLINKESVGKIKRK